MKIGDKIRILPADTVDKKWHGIEGEYIQCLANGMIPYHLVGKFNGIELVLRNDEVEIVKNEA